MIVKPNINNQQNILIGKWKITGLYYFVPKKGRKLFKQNGQNGYTWNFKKDMRTSIRSGGASFCGDLEERFASGGRETTRYAYFPSERKLYIDRSAYEPDGFCDICIEDRYLVEVITADEYWLYDLQDVEKESDDFLFRIKIKRHTGILSRIKKLLLK